MLTFEDFKPGHFMTLGPRRVVREEIIAFASEFDPQPMHLDDKAGRDSLLGGGLSGSGWHMCALAMRMQVDGYLNTQQSRRARVRGALAGARVLTTLHARGPRRPGATVDSRPNTGIIHFA